MSENLEPIKVSTQIRGKKGRFLVNVTNSMTLSFHAEDNKQLIKQTGVITEINPPEKNRIVVLAKKRSWTVDAAPKKYRLDFENSVDLDHFRANYQAVKNKSSINGVKYDGVYAGIHIWVNTWNQGDKSPPNEYYQWVRLESQQAPEIMVFSAQEADISGENFFSQLNAVLPGYFKVCGEEMGQIRLAIFVRDDVQSAIPEITVSMVKTGLGNVVANKGGILAAFRFFESPIAIISSHLNAHQANIQRRNEDFMNIVTQCNLNIEPKDLLTEYHHIIWAGDLNYRIDLPIQNVHALIHNKMYSALYQRDQLRHQIEAGKAFGGFIEGSINFQPTYKYDAGTTTYDTKKSRIPAYCDRVLVRSFPGLNPVCTKYSCNNDILTSDHHPVYAIWKLNVVKPTPPPPPFSSVIGMRPYIEFTDLKLDIKKQILSTFLEFRSSFMEKSCFTATGTGKYNVVFPDDCVPMLVSTAPMEITHLRSLYITIYCTIDDIIYIAILPLSLGLVDVYRYFSIEVRKGFNSIGTLSGSLKIVNANEGYIQYAHSRHLKAKKHNQFESRIFKS